MSLNWSLKDIENFEEVCYEGEGDNLRLNPATECLIFASMNVGFGRITEKNWKNFYKRLAVYERLFGSFRVKYVDGGAERLYYTPAEIKAHIGLSTNVSDETDAAWQKRIMKYALQDAERDIKNDD